MHLRRTSKTLFLIQKRTELHYLKCYEFAAFSGTKNGKTNLISQKMYLLFRFNNQIKKEDD